MSKKLEIPSVPSDCPAEDKEYVQEMINKIADHIKVNGHPYKWSIKDFQIGAPMGRGKFGRVYLAREKTTGYMVALKMLFKSELVKAEMQHQVVREIEIQTHLHHENILRLLTYFYDEKKIYLVLEFAAGGEMYKQLQLQPEGRFGEATAAKYIDQVASAIHFCHQNKVIHRDIKPENLLLDADGNVKLADFGWSVHAPSFSRKTMCGTVDYLPPEMLSNKHYDHRVDHWCIGVLCYEFLVGKPPFESNDQKTTFARIKAVDVKYPSFLSADSRSFIQSLLRKDPKERMELTEVKHHPWIVKYLGKRNEDGVETANGQLSSENI